MTNPYPGREALSYILLYTPIFLWIAFAWWRWRQFKIRFPERGFNYRITDLWWGQAGMLPSVFLAIWVIKEHENSPLAFPMPWFELFFFALCQLIGMFIGKLQHELSVSDKRYRTASLHVFFGTLIGLIVPVISCVLYMLVFRDF